MNNMVVPTRYAALPYHFQLDEHGVRTGLVENLNTMRETEKGIETGRPCINLKERERKRERESEGEWVAEKKYEGEKRETDRKGREVLSVSA